MIIKLFYALLLAVSVCSFAEQVERLYDFDHKVFYKETRFNAEHYLLEVEADSYNHFEKQSVFLLRHAVHLCGGVKFSLIFISGVQEFSVFADHPRSYQAPLTAQLKCLNQEVEPVK